MKFPVDALVSVGLEFSECESCPLFVFQFAKVYAVPPQLNGDPDAE